MGVIGGVCIGECCSSSGGSAGVGEINIDGEDSTLQASDSAAQVASVQVAKNRIERNFKFLRVTVKILIQIHTVVTVQKIMKIRFHFCINLMCVQ